jgi:signal peptidase II
MWGGQPFEQKLKLDKYFSLCYNSDIQLHHSKWRYHLTRNLRLSKGHSYLFIILLVVIDQVTKYIAQKIEGEIVLGWGFGIKYVVNRGLLLGLLSQNRYASLIGLVLDAIGALLVCVIYHYYIHNYNHTFIVKLSFVFLVSGIVGNGIDGVFFGYVRDFIVWPGPGIPNFADVFGSIGIILALIEIMRSFGMKKTFNRLFRGSIADDKKFLLELKSETINIFRRQNDRNRESDKDI